MLKLILDKGGNPIVEDRSIEHHLEEVVNAVGAKLIRVSVSDFTLSDEVSKRANAAAGETFQLDAQIKSAKALRESRKILKPRKGQAEEPGYELATILAAGQDNPNVKVIHVSGGADRLARAAALVGTSKE